MKRDIVDFSIDSKRVILRCDLNVPMSNGIIQDDTRIKASIKTIDYLLENNAKIIILSHLGRIKEEKDKENNSLKPVAKRMSELLDKEVKFVNETRGKKVENAINNMNNGDIVMLENTRFEDLDNNKESNNDIELASYWASLGEIFINDAFGMLHRSHASNVGIAKFLPSGIGFLVKEEVDRISNALENPKRPFVIIIGGAKVSSKIDILLNAVKIADYILIGGAMPYTFFNALGYNVGSSVVDYESIDFCKKIYNENKNKIILPKDTIVTDCRNIKMIDIDTIKNDEKGMDIGIKTINEYKNIISNANTIIWNGPVGMFEDERFSNGTKSIIDILNNSNANIIIGGGDTIRALNKFNFQNKNAYISTGGGATLEMLEGKELPGLKVIENKK